VEPKGVGAALDASGRSTSGGVTRTSDEAGGGYVLARYFLEG
jgi:hypothetical protein